MRWPAAIKEAVLAEGRPDDGKELDRRGVPKGVVELVYECWRPRAQDRPTMATVAARLEQLLLATEQALEGAGVAAAAAAAARVAPLPLPRWHAFLSHSQASGGDQCLALREALSAPRAPFRAAEAWLDQDCVTSAASMREGVRESALFVLFLSPGVLARPYCQMEIKTALEAGVEVACVLDDDPAHGGVPLQAILAEGLAHSRSRAQRAAGCVHLEESDFDRLFPGGQSPAWPVIPFRRGEDFLAVTVPQLLVRDGE